MSWVAVASIAVGAGTSIYSANKASKAGRPSKSQSQLEGLLADQTSKTSPMGLQLLGDATSGLDDLDHYYQALSEGDRSKLLELLGPGVLDADSARRDATSADMSLMPRGAGSAERRLQLLDTGVTNRENALLGARSAARSARGDIATARGSLGSSVLSGSSSTGLGLLGEILNRKTVGFDQERAAGQALWQIMQLFGPSGGAKTTERGTIPRGSNISQFMGSTPGVKPTSTMSPYGPYN